MKILTKLLTVLTLASSLTFTTQQTFASNSKSMEGHASWYGPGFHGRLAADGKPFNMNRLTAAHKTLPFGTKLKVTCKTSGKSVIVTVTDRGPYIRGRTLDLSYAAAKAIGMIDRGTGRVKIQVLN